MNQQQIKFYSKSSKYFEFSNFYITPMPIVIDINGIQEPFKTTEHYYQAMKYYVPQSAEHMNIFRQIQFAKTPTEAFYLGKFLKGKFEWIDELIVKNKGLTVRNDWDTDKIVVMCKAIHAKFTQNPVLSQMLIKTGKAELIENSPYDTFWGIGRKGDGQNQLGKLLMELRDELRKGI